jgi:hypothetical protein
MPCERHGETCDARCIDPNVDNGMMTKVWGPAGWLFLHCVALGYPYHINNNNPDHKTKKEDYYKFFYYLGRILPCKYCRDSYMEFFADLNLEGNLNSRNELSRWLYDMHNKVNRKLGVSECRIPTFEETTDEYEKYRAKCKKTTEEERNINKSKGCLAPADGTAKRCVVRVINFHKGDITRRNNSLANKKETGLDTDTDLDAEYNDVPNQDDYIIINKYKVITIGVVILILILIIIILLTVKIKTIKWK